MTTHAITDTANANAICVDGADRAETPSSAVPAIGSASEQTTLTDADVQRIAAAVCEKLGTNRSDTRYWNIERAAHECTVDKRTFAEWMARGKVSFYKIKRRVFIDPKLMHEELAPYLQRRTPKRRKRQTQQQTSALAADQDSGLLEAKAA